MPGEDHTNVFSQGSILNILSRSFPPKVKTDNYFKTEDDFYCNGFFAISAAREPAYLRKYRVNQRDTKIEKILNESKIFFKTSVIEIVPMKG